METEIQHILQLLENAFEKNAWHGPAIKEVLNDITQEQAIQRLNSTHSIIELVAHITSWRNFVILKLQGYADFKMTEEMNFPALSDWSLTLKELDKSQEKLVVELKQFPSAKLSDIVPSSKHHYTFYTLIHGMIHHDVYHAGQIMLIKKTFQ